MKMKKDRRYHEWYKEGDVLFALSAALRLSLEAVRTGPEILPPYDGKVSSSSSQQLRVRGGIDLPIRLGSKEVSVKMVVADKLYVDAILGVDALGAFSALIDVAERTLTLKDTGEVHPLGMTVVRDVYMATNDLVSTVTSSWPSASGG
ncbi:hypothetical protein PInf_014668 [Phytophthora infestans]|nr:hypothetical protein PInf_014668 [Phytophthora infestans]